MARVKVVCEIDTYPECNEEGNIVIVESHWSDDDRIHLIIGKENHIVIGSDLITAIKNCMNTD